jgi:hypothetical protein
MRFPISPHSMYQEFKSELPNKPLVPTRNGEAPLLAAQRRRWADERFRRCSGQDTSKAPSSGQ